MSSMTHYTEKKYFSIFKDCDMSRVSGFDDRCQEHWIDVEAGRGYRDRRNVAISKLQDSIENGDPPGELK